MKKILISILTVFVTLSLLVLSIVSNIEASITSSVGSVVQEQLTKNVVKYVTENSNIKKENIETAMKQVLEKTDGVQNIFDSYIDRAIKIVAGESVEEINVSKEIEAVMNQSEDILKEYGVEIPEEEKEKLFSYIEEQDINKKLNDSIKEIQDLVPNEAKEAIEIYNFLRSSTFKMILICSIVACILLIAILKSSYYKWLSNLGTGMIINGIMIGIVLPLLINYASRMLDGSYLKTESFANYGYITLIIGIICVILNIIITKYLQKQQTQTIEL